MGYYSQKYLTLLLPKTSLILVQIIFRGKQARTWYSPKLTNINKDSRIMASSLLCAWLHIHPLWDKSFVNWCVFKGVNKVQTRFVASTQKPVCQMRIELNSKSNHLNRSFGVDAHWTNRFNDYFEALPPHRSNSCRSERNKKAPGKGLLPALPLSSLGGLPASLVLKALFMEDSTTPSRSCKQSCCLVDSVIGSSVRLRSSPEYGLDRPILQWHADKLTKAHKHTS